MMKSNKSLIIVDVQSDFCPGGGYASKGIFKKKSEEIIKDELQIVGVNIIQSKELLI
jgi:nicotinamidase-related amidase